MLFEFDDVSVRFGETTVLDRVTFETRERLITVIAGPSGAGKSTLLRLCNRLEVPASGSIRLVGTPISAIDPLVLRRRVGMVFQRPTLFGGTVRDNLAVARVAGEETYAEALERVGLDRRFLDKLGDDLSGGEAQRACLARTLLTGPEVLLMDEPTSSLDPAATEGLEQLVGDLVDGGLSVLWVTHDLAQAARIGTEHVVLIDGRVAGPAAAAHYLGNGEPPRPADPGRSDPRGGGAQ